MYRKNTAGQFVAFQGVDATTGGIKSGVTWTMRRCIDGTFAAGGGTVTEDSTNGWYKCALTQADTNGNDIAYNFTGTGAVPQTINVITTACDPTTATNFGITALPTTAVSTNASLLTSGTGTDQLSVTTGRVDMGKALGTAVTLDANNVLNVSAKYVGGTLLTARDIGASVLLSAGTGTGQLDFTTGVVKANATQWVGGTIPAVNVTGVPLVDLKYTLGTISPATAGSVRADSVTANVGITAAAVSSIWQDTTAADFTTALSVGKSIMNGVALGTGLTINGYTGNTPQTGDNYARIGAPAGASVSADIAAIKSDTGTTLTDVNTGAGAIYTRLGAPAGASIAADIAAVKTDTALHPGIRKNVALAKFEFLMTDSTNHAPVTGKTVTVTRSIDNGAFGAGALSAVTEISNGIYSVDFAAGDLNGGVVTLRATASSCDDTLVTIVTNP